MPHDAAVVPPIHQRHTVLILRLTLDSRGRLYQGVAIDRDEQIVGRFRNWQELVVLLQHCWPAQAVEE